VTAPPGAGTRADVERWLLRRGVPHLIDGYDPREDVLVRLRPLLVVLFVLGMALALRPSWPWWGRGLAALAGVALVIAAYVLLNLARGRPAAHRPERVGFTEAALLVLAPAAVDALLGGGLRETVGIAAGALVIAVAGYALTSLGILSLLVHLGRAALEGLAETAAVAARAMPLMLAVLLFLFLASEVWETLGTVEGWRFGAVFAAFAVLGAGVLVGALRPERRALLAPRPGDEARRRALATPAAPLVGDGDPPPPPALTRMQRVNVTVAMLTSLGVRVVAVGAAVGLFFLLFGLLVMTPETTAAWTGQTTAELPVLADVQTARGRIVLSEPLVRASILLGAFAAVYFAVAAVGDDRNRREFVDDELERLHGVMAAWLYYRAGPRPPS